jgi:predicted naringenin-chalcone synthase
MSISKEVPIKLAMEVHEKLFKLFDQAGLSDHEKVLKEAVFAIHPGGPRILSQLQTLLELNDEQVSDAGQILYDRGNMSSATLPNTWDRILSNDLDDGQLIVSLAFGPGLTMFGSVMEYHK